ncbi:GIY-YIG nuclease family protein [Parvibaculum sp.]|uniref:GIY-YIG nuclease family protein n=1 Tax=Parvibaculum sp. TaxID=2024848 RepID=UPI0038B3BC13
MSRGWIYILSNEQNRTDLFKVGITTRSPEVRARELHNTSSAFPWRVEYAALVDDCRAVEQQVQLQLKKHRVALNREFDVSP